jgi:hypothetical protein
MSIGVLVVSRLCCGYALAVTRVTLQPDIVPWAENYSTGAVLNVKSVSVQGGSRVC